jgi:hypothetical protein
MAGRLRILPHKSWHVWTTDNIEKVKRDERLHKEEIEQAGKKSRDVKSEQLLAQLLSKDTQEDVDSDIIQHDLDICENKRKEESVVPMKDVRINRQADNIEYKKEKEEKELLQKRHEGSAPFQLVPGEYTKQTPWYMNKKPHTAIGVGYIEGGEAPMSTAGFDTTSACEANSVIATLLQPPPTTGRNSSLHQSSTQTQTQTQTQTLKHQTQSLVTSRGKRLQGQAAVAFLDRDSARKVSADPMAPFLHPSSVHMTSHQSLPSELTINPSLLSSSLLPPSSSSSSSSSTTTLLSQALPRFSHLNNVMGGNPDLHALDKKRKKELKSHTHSHANDPKKQKREGNSRDDGDGANSDTEEGIRIKKPHKKENKNHHRKHKHKHNKEKRESSSGKVKHTHSHSNSRRHHHHHHSSSSSSSSSRHSPPPPPPLPPAVVSAAGAGAMDASLLLALRQKRLERERDAQLKTDLYIAQR